MADVKFRTIRFVPVRRLKFGISPTSNLKLIKKRAVFSYAESEFAGYSRCYPPYGMYIEGPFSQGQKMAEDMVGSIMMVGFIAQMNTLFKVNLQQRKETYETYVLKSSRS